MPRTPDERDNCYYHRNYYAGSSDPDPLDTDDTFDLNQLDPDLLDPDPMFPGFRGFPGFRRFRRFPFFFFFPIFFRRRRRRRMPY